MSYHKKIKPQDGEALSTPEERAYVSPAEIQAAIDLGHKMRAEEAGVIARAVANGMKSAFYAVFGGFIEGAKRRQAIGYLNGMSDHVLRDIGLSRAEIASVVVNGPAEDSVRPRKQAKVVATDPIVDASVRHAA